ncbi:hypothetical protein Tco_1121720 [Tanacetum coccineum]|uniref:Uncharacterized protein n=1 Tax=Tanacetum coccineum TaxID=301880 RepID=A0ABQ5IZW4_9ASTR
MCNIGCGVELHHGQYDDVDGSMMGCGVRTVAWCSGDDGGGAAGVVVGGWPDLATALEKESGGDVCVKETDALCTHRRCPIQATSPGNNDRVSPQGCSDGDDDDSDGWCVVMRGDRSGGSMVVENDDVDGSIIGCGVRMVAWCSDDDGGGTAGVVVGGWPDPATTPERESG